MNCEADKIKDVFAYLEQLLEEMKKARSAQGNDSYQAYLHGQVYGAALVLRLLYPGPGNLGERAALLARPVITEHQCRCGD